MSKPTEKNRYAGYLMMVVRDRPASKTELRDMILLSIFYQQRMRKELKIAPLALKEEIYKTVYYPARKTGNRKGVYNMMDKIIAKAIRDGFMTEPASGMYDITDRGKEMLRWKGRVLESIGRTSIPYFATRYKANLSVNRAYIYESKALLESDAYKEDPDVHTE